jgi:DNA-binding MarR family transcriptional regulator
MADTETMSGDNKSAPAVQWLNSTEQAAWRGLWESTRQLFATLEGQLQDDAHMPLAHYDILVTLSEAPQRTLRMGTLATCINSSPSRLSHTMTRLEHLSWVRREAVPGDRRATVAILTDEGAAALADAAPGHVTAVREHLIDALTEEQLTQLKNITEAITALATTPPVKIRPSIDRAS